MLIPIAWGALFFRALRGSRDVNPPTFIESAGRATVATRAFTAAMRALAIAFVEAEAKMNAFFELLQEEEEA